MISIIVAGSSKYTNEQFVHKELDRLLIMSDNFELEDIEIVSGKAKGVDTFGETWAKKRGVKIKEFPAKWRDFTPPYVIKSNSYGEYNALAGNKRNKQMAEYGTHLIAFDGNTPGTNDMIQQAKSNNLTIIEIIKI